jgi:hypothetical protein
VSGFPTDVGKQELSGNPVLAFTGGTLLPAAAVPESRTGT